MIKLDQGAYTKLKNVIELLKDTPNEVVRNQISRLEDAIVVEDGSAYIREGDAASFYHDYNNLIKILRDGAHHNYHFFFRPRDTFQDFLRTIEEIPEDALFYATVDRKPVPQSIYEDSQTLQKTRFSQDVDTYIIQIMKLLPIIRREVENYRLSLMDTINLLANAGKIPKLPESYEPLIRDLDDYVSYDVMFDAPVSYETSDSISDLIDHVVDKQPYFFHYKRLAPYFYHIALERDTSLKDFRYRTAMAYQRAYDQAVRQLEETGQPSSPADLLARVEKISHETEEQYSYVGVDKVILFKVLLADHRIKTDVRPYWRFIDAYETYRKYRILQEMDMAELSTPEQLIPKLIVLLPIIEAELGPNLTIRKIVEAFLTGKNVTTPHEPFLERAAAYDLFNHPIFDEIEPEDFTSSATLVDKLMQIRLKVPDYEDAPLLYFATALEAMGRLEAIEARALKAHAAAYDTAFNEIMNIDIYELPEPMTVSLVQNLMEIAARVTVAYNEEHSNIDISMLTLVKYLISRKNIDFPGGSKPGSLREYEKPFLISAAMADLIFAFDLFTGLEPLTTETPQEPVVVTDVSKTDFPDRSKFDPDSNFKSLITRAAAQELTNLFIREINEEDLASPEALIEKLSTIRDTLDGYEHEPYATFVLALAAINKLPGKTKDQKLYVRYAKAYDFYDLFRHYINDEALNNPELLFERLDNARTGMEGYEHEPLQTFIEALAIIGKIPGNFEKYFNLAAIFDAQLEAAAGNDPESGSSPVSPPAQGGVPFSPPSNGNPRARGVDDELVNKSILLGGVGLYRSMHIARVARTHYPQRTINTGAAIFARNAGLARLTVQTAIRTPFKPFAICVVAP